MIDDYHVGIRSVDDIKTFAEAMQDEESFVWEDFSNKDAQKALEKGIVTVYSSKPIEQGSFVSTSKNMAQDYAGNGKVYSQEVNLNDVAWINEDEGQYAKVDIANNQETLYNNNESESDIDDGIGNESTNRENIRESKQGDSNRGGSKGRTSDELESTTETEKITNYKQKLDIIDNAKKNIEKVNCSKNMTDVFNKLDIKLYGYSNENVYSDGLSYNGEAFINNKGNNSTEILGAHELIHTLRQKGNNETYNTKIVPIINDVAYNDNYRDPLIQYVRNNDLAIGYMDEKYRKILAEEVIADTSSDILADYNSNYNIGEENKNKLEKALMEITDGKKFVENNLAEDSEQSSFNMPAKGEDIITQKQTMPMNEDQTEQRVANILEKPVKQVKENDRKWAVFKASILDKGIVFEELSQKTKNRELQSKWDFTLSSGARGQNAIGNARYEFENGKQKQISKSLTDIIDEVGESSSDFQNYMYHQLNIDRMTLEDRFGGDTL